MLNDIKAVLFDLDGTLVESMSMWGDIDVDYLKKFHIPVPEGLQKAIEGLSMYQTAVYFKENFAIEDSLEEIMDDWTPMTSHNKRTKRPKNTATHTIGLRVKYECLFLSQAI